MNALAKKVSMLVVVMMTALLGCNGAQEECHKLSLEVKRVSQIHADLEAAADRKNKDAFAKHKAELTEAAAKVSAVELKATSGYQALLNQR